jgi:hypothetical protein
MRWNSLDDEQCSAARAVAVMGDRWTLSIFRECVRRFDEFHRGLASRDTCLPCGSRSSCGSVNCGAIDAERVRPGTGMSRPDVVWTCIRS